MNYPTFIGRIYISKKMPRQAIYPYKPPSKPLSNHANASANASRPTMLMTMMKRRMMTTQSDMLHSRLPI